MSKGAPPPGQSGGDNSLDFVWLIVLVVGAALAIWYFEKKYIVEGVFFIKFYEIIVIKFLANFWNKFAFVVHLPSINTLPLDNLVKLIQKNHDQVGFNTLIKINTDVGKYTRYPLGILLFVSAIFVYFGSVTSKFKTTFSLKSLRESESKIWPRIKPLINLDLVKEDIDKGGWAMGMTPMQFCKKNNLLKIEKEKNGQPTVSLLRGEAYKIFALQLGTPWKGNINSLPKHIRTLLIIFAARANGDIDPTDEILDKIAASAINGKPEFETYDELANKHLNSKLAIRVLQRHAYISTMMAAMLDLARRSGVAASADFLWLKPLDRKLWYILNSVGRQTAAAEAAGIFSHWQTERKFGRPFRTPMVDSAVNALEEALKDIIYDPDDL